MGFNRFSLLIITRTIFVVLTLVLLAYFLLTPGYHAATILTLLLIAFQFNELIRFVKKTNAELSRFLDAARYADFSQRFSLTEFGTGFEELGKVFDEILLRLQAERATQEEELRHLKALVEHVPVPLISLYSDQRITIWNNAARRLFGSNVVTKLSDFSQFSDDFPGKLKELNIGETTLIDIFIDGVAHRLSISATQVTINQQQETLVSLQDIQSELDIAQLQAWQDLVRVLTHEIMNSITPVASLAKTAVDLVADIQRKTIHSPIVVDELEDVSDAVQTVAKRSEGLMGFVSSYRRLTRLPPPELKLFKISDLLSQVQTIATQTYQQQGISLFIEIQPKALDIVADRNMIEQVLINLLQNAEHAVVACENPLITLSAKLSKRGRVMIEISDNGCGISDETIDKIFVPFFTTKRNGSGVGLALTRQIMIAHKGNIKVQNNVDKGVTFTLVF